MDLLTELRNRHLDARERARVALDEVSQLEAAIAGIKSRNVGQDQRRRAHDGTLTTERAERIGRPSDGKTITDRALACMPDDGSTVNLHTIRKRFQASGGNVESTNVAMTHLVRLGLVERVGSGLYRLNNSTAEAK